MKQMQVFDLFNQFLASQNISLFFLARQVATIAIIVLVTWGFLEVIKLFLINKIENLSKKTQNSWDDKIFEAIQKIGWPLYFILALYAVSQLNKFQPFIKDIISSAALIITIFYVLRVVLVFVNHSLDQYFSRKKTDTTTKTIFRSAATYSLWAVAIIFVLQNLGYNLTALLGGLGLAGIAVGFALQNVLGDVFSFFALYLDKPFEVGDFVVVGNDSGTVEHMGLKSTRIKTLQGQELVVSNQELTTSRINNYKKMDSRRIEFSFGVTYDTTDSKLRKINSIIEDIFNEVEQATLNRVHFRNLGESSLNFEVVYHLDSSEYNVYMDTQQEINFQMIEKFRKAKISFAYPTQEIILHK